MAGLNTENRRRAALRRLPAPDNHISRADRRQITRNYPEFATMILTTFSNYSRPKE